MKKFLPLLLFLGLLGCSVSDDGPNSPVRTVYTPISAVSGLPDSFDPDQIYEITLTYVRPSSCYTNPRIETDANGNNLYLTMVSLYDPSNMNCEEIEDTAGEFSFEFRVERNDFYIFNFWQGYNAFNQPVYLKMEIPVTGSGSTN